MNPTYQHPLSHSLAVTGEGELGGRTLSPSQNDPVLHALHLWWSRQALAAGSFSMPVLFCPRPNPPEIIVFGEQAA